MIFSTINRVAAYWPCQIIRMATQPSLLPYRSVANVLNMKRRVFINTIATPMRNTVRSFRTTRPLLIDDVPHDHSKLWVVEKAVSAALVPLVPIGLVLRNRVFDSIIAILITVHAYWGLEACVVEYLRVLVVGPVVPKVAMMVVYGMSAVMLGGLFFIIFNDIGLCRAFWRIWKSIRKNKPAK